jgi:hypothetical protein
VSGIPGSLSDGSGNVSGGSGRLFFESGRLSAMSGSVSGDPGSVFSGSGSPSGLSGRQILDSNSLSANPGSLFFKPGRLSGRTGSQLSGSGRPFIGDCVVAAFGRKPAFESGGGPPHSTTQSVGRRRAKCAKRLGVRQSSGAFGQAEVKRRRKRSTTERERARDWWDGKPAREFAIGNPNGIPSISPGLRTRATLGHRFKQDHQPQRGCITVLPDGFNPFRVVFICIRPPSVCRLRRPTLG